MAVKITIKDNGANHVLATAGTRLRVTVGVIGSDAEKQHDGAPQGMTVAAIAEKHELGLGVPERSFLRAYVDAEEQAIKRDLRAAFQQILRGKFSPRRAAEIIGLRHASGVQQFIADRRVKPPNTAYTIARKGSDVPLIDTGQLRAAITYHVEEVSGLDQFYGANAKPPPSLFNTDLGSKAFSRQVSKAAKGVAKSARNAGKDLAKATRKAEKAFRKTERQAERLARKGSRVVRKQGKLAAKKIKRAVKLSRADVNLALRSAGLKPLKRRSKRKK